MTINPLKSCQKCWDLKNFLTSFLQCSFLCACTVFLFHCYGSNFWTLDPTLDNWMYWYCTLLWTRRHSSRAHLYDTLNDYHFLQSPILLHVRQRLPDRDHARCCVTFLTYWCCFILEVPWRSQRLDHHFCLVGIFLPVDKFLPYDLLRRQYLLRRRDYLRNGGNLWWCMCWRRLRRDLRRTSHLQTSQKQKTMYRDVRNPNGRIRKTFFLLLKFHERQILVFNVL